MNTHISRKENVHKNIFTRIFLFYYEGFKSMTLGKTLWLIIIIKLAIMFGLLKIFFFPNFLNSHFETEKEKSEYVGTQLIDKSKQ
ncbi:MAG: DUF4492 domain-containing protein [Bacteroidales bacterium]